MKRHLTFANVGSTVALIAVVAGATAFGLPGKNSVQSNDLRKNSVKAKAIAKNAVRSAEVRLSSVGSAEVPDLGLSYADLGSNSVVARLRLAGPIASGDATIGTPKVVPLTGSPWNQAANEIHVFFGEGAISVPGPCGGPDAEVRVEFWVDGEQVDAGEFETDELLTLPTLIERPFIFEPGNQPQTHNAELRISDDCANAGEQLVLQRYDVNVVAIR
jgi:hypothetical protein